MNKTWADRIIDWIIWGDKMNPKKKSLTCSRENCGGLAVEKDEDGRLYCREHFEYLYLKGEL